MKNLLSGLGYLLEGFSLITRPGLKRYVIIPVLLNTLVFIALFLLATHYFKEFNLWFQQLLPTWLHWLYYVVWLFFFISYFFFFIYTFVVIGNLIASPFNSLLAERVEWYLTGELLPEKSWGEFIKSIPHIVGRQMAIFAYYLSRVVVLIILIFIPFLHFFVPFLWFMFNALFMAITYLDYPADNHQISIPEIRARIRQKPIPTLGFGISVMLASMIPFINFFTISAATAGAMKLWVEEFSIKS